MEVGETRKEVTGGNKRRKKVKERKKYKRR